MTSTMAVRVAMVAGLCVTPVVHVPVSRAEAREPRATQVRAGADRPSGSWKRVKSANFVAVGNASDRDLRQALRELEVFRFGVSRLLPSVRFRTPTPLMVMFRDDGALTPFKPRDSEGRRQDWVGGYYVDLPEGAHMVMAASRIPNPEVYGLVLHEYAHDVIRLNLPRLPRWINEGLAEFYSSIAGMSVNGRRLLGRPLDSRIRTLRTKHLLPLEDLIVLERADAIDVGRIDMFYAQSWALVHYLLVGRENRKPGQLTAYVDLIGKGRSSVEAFSQTFDTTLDTMSRELTGYARRVSFPAVPLEEPPDAGRAVASEAVPMLESEAESLQGLLLVSGGNYEDAEEHLLKTLAADPASTPGRTLLARQRLATDRADEAVTLLRSVVETTPNSAPARSYLGKALMETTQYQEAVDQYTRATALEPGRAEYWFGLSVAAMALDRVAEAATAIERARQLSDTPGWYWSRVRELWRIGRDAAVVRDVATYLELSKSAGISRAYAAFTGALSARRLVRPADADAFLVASEASARSSPWTENVWMFMQGRLPAEQLLRRARGNGEETEARAYIGVSASLAGRRDEALLHLRWVKTRGSKSYTEYGLATAELARLELTGSAPASC